MDPNALQQFLSQRISQGLQNEKTFSDRLAERRQFVQQQENGATSVMQGLLSGQGSNGVPISASTVLNPLADFTTQNANQTAEANQGLMAAQNQTNSAAGDLMQFFNQQQSHAEAEKQLQMQSAINGLKYDPKTGEFNYPSVTDASGKDIPVGPQAVNQVIKQGGKDILDQAGNNEVSKRMLAASILAAGGVGAYRSKYADTMSPQDRQSIAGSNLTLTQINNVANRIHQSKALRNVMGKAGNSQLADWALKSGNTIVLHKMGLNADDIAALADMTALSTSTERQLIGGRLSGYLVNKLGPANPTIDKQPNDNLEILNNVKTRLTADLAAYAKQKGYRSYSDIPGISPDSTKQPTRAPLSSFVKK